MITLITMTQGNMIALERTIKSFQKSCSNIVVGNLCIFGEDIAKLKDLELNYCIKVVDLPFNYIYLNGFASVLNRLSEEVKTPYALYMNVGEIAVNDIMQVNERYNTYYFDHDTEKHHWYRCYKVSDLKWSGVIHEELIGNKRPYPVPMFRMADTQKDNDNPFKASVYNDIKEIVYFNQYLRLVDEPQSIGSTNMGWVNYAKDSYQQIKSRLLNKGERYNAFVNSDFDLYLHEIKTKGVPDQFDNNKIIHFQ
jgi:hypothetical protein